MKNDTNPIIFEKVTSIFKDGTGVIYHTNEIKDLVVESYPNTNRKSIIHSDYCYNLVNKDKGYVRSR